MSNDLERYTNLARSKAVPIIIEVRRVERRIDQHLQRRALRLLMAALIAVFAAWLYLITQGAPAVGVIAGGVGIALTMELINVGRGR